MDGHTEYLNAVIEWYLECYVNYLQHDWPKWLPLAEFAVSNQMNKSTKISPFFANTGLGPKITTDIHLPAHRDRDDARAYGLAS